MSKNKFKLTINCSDSDNILKWSKYYHKEITSRDYEEICFNLKGFFDTLYGWEDDCLNNDCTFDSRQN